MIELLRFQNLRPAQSISGEERDQIGLPLYPDPGLSALANDLIDAADRGQHDALFTRFQDTGNVLTDLTKADPAVRLLYDWLNFKARPIRLADFKTLVAALRCDKRFDLERAWRLFADNLLFAIHADRLAANYCLDYQLLVRICHLIRATLDRTDDSFAVKPDVTDALIAQLLEQSLLIPPGAIFSRCPSKCRKIGGNPLPNPNPTLADATTPPQTPTPTPSDDPCHCECDTECKPPVDHRVCIRPYMGDLFLIREELARYEAGELADIENILAGEAKVRHHRMLNRTEASLELESTTETSTERDHSVAEKFTLQEEVKSTAEQRTNLDAGVTATLKYGDSVTVTPHANVTANWAKSQSQSLARGYAKDVVDRAVTKLAEKTRRLQITKTLREVEEINQHSIKNDDPTAVHRAGLYFWVNKVTHAQVMNYGRHMMFDLIVPEPAATFKTLFARKQASDVAVEQPKKPDITVAKINMSGYGELLAKYGIASTEALEPPDPMIFIQFALSGNIPKPDGNKSMAFSSHDIKSPEIPDGYRATKLSYDVRCSSGHPATTGDKDEVAVSVNIADFNIFTQSLNEYKSGGGKTNQDWSAAGEHVLKGEEGSIAASFAGFSSVALALNASFTIQVELKAEAFDKWRLKIYNAIMSDYLRKLEAWEQAKAPKASLFAIKGRNPFLNREIERNELKRHVIAALMGNYFAGIGAMMERVQPCGYPAIDFVQLEKDAPLIQFFEQVFEWEYLTYLFYHSMWARKCKWPELIDEDSGDPLFDKFLTAGATRVQVPVRPGMEHVFTWFLATGQIWGSSGEPPLPGDDEFVAMIQELKEARQGDYDERPGLVDVTKGSNVLALHDSGYYWDAVGAVPNKLLLDNDRDREILINYKVYRIVKVEQAKAGDTTKWNITINEPYPDASAADHKHATGAVFVGAPWEVVMPTQLVYLRNPKDALPTYPLS
ncbi:hypothetical protein [Sphingomonas alpina]|uniref:Uncharacterized protein n=1 Tax=Sphingomonas alpina TaxID=653931 RepID=A0A7H0LGQ7_9SPHN|nr:hypothetical protein [Sphingomonas alpina]QNQ08860.1 hypothetical protein H3Z74_19415 [Sphingomonas alpina]